MKKWILAFKIIILLIKKPSASYISVVEKVYKDALEKNPNDRFLLWFLSNQYVRHEKYSEAENYLDRLIKSDDENRDSTLLLSKVYFHLLKYEEVVSLLKKNSLLNSGDIENYYLGYSLIELKRYDEAEKYLSNYATNYPDDYVGHTRLGYVYFMIGKYQKALEEYRLSETINPNREEIKESINLCLEKLNPEGNA